MINFINIKPRDYQSQILKELNDKKGIGLFMGTGTGKTLTSLLKVNTFKVNNLLVICPAKVIDQWFNEIKKHSLGLNIIEPKKSWACAKKDAYIKSNLKAKDNVVVVGIESIFRYNLLPIIDKDWAIIVDESHKMKEMGTTKKPVKSTHAILTLGRQTPFKVILTATPTQKDKGGYIDYYSQLHFLDALKMSYQAFKDRYCIYKKIQPIGMPYPIKIIDRYRNTDEIDEILKSCCRRYECKFNDFEPQHIKIDLDMPKNYKKLVRESYYEDLDLSNLSQKRIAYKTLCSGTIGGVDIYKGKHYYKDNTIKIDWLEEFMGNTNEKIVIFYNYNVEREQLKELCEKLHKVYIVIDGANNHKIQDIARNDYDVVIGQFNACGESIDGLQYKSHICIYYSIPESSLAYRQALGRINRIGQEKVPMYYYLVCKGTIEDAIYDMIQSKIEYNEKTLNKLVVDLSL